ncbi:TRAP transporter substrate-binding protein DctP [Marinobacter zhejiangensis]|uniref:TRAP-type mannitol/chloroaromatic compound transport system, substrate-binding protein n=1 Tax=Marinobacter zhejiangensis TaxID=488535 RepID=A0A1I4LUY2_9GAMM|nr:TRAP transporter substrate-binding protein DctP [Marinobacter zhejiangensis]SFL94814.1 TRAP-type mannitol/chloroaromatic compound transport system, substrate-binding protein [Marinobacter zhejiangensis]
MKLPLIQRLSDCVRHVPALALAATMALSVNAHAQENPEVSWRMQALWDAGTTPYEFEQKFVARVAELTDGKFTIRLFGGGQLVPSSGAFEAVRGGAFELMKTFDGYEAGAIPAFAFTSTVPFGFPESDQYEAWFYERGGLDMAREAYAQAGLFYIAPTVYGQEPIHATFPIHSLDDIKGKKGRFVGLSSAVMGAFGVSTTPLPTAEVYQALEKGVIDFADRGDLTANLEAGLDEVANYVIVPGFHQPTTATSYVANQRAYDRLPDAYKAALETAAREISVSLRQHIVAQDAVALEAFEERGVNVIHLEPEVITEGRREAVDAWRQAAGDNELAKRVLQSQVAFMQELGLLD